MPGCDVQINATFTDLSQDAAIQSITVLNVNAQADSTSGTVYGVELPFGTILSALTASDIIVLPTNSAAKVTTAYTSNGGSTWTFVIAAEDTRFTQTYTLNVAVSTTLYIDITAATFPGIKTFAITTALKKIVIQVDSKSITPYNIYTVSANTFGAEYTLIPSADGQTTAYSLCTIYAPTDSNAPVYTTGGSFIALFIASSFTYYVDITTNGDCITSFILKKV